ncbi:hypothetical protein DT381_15560 [Pseudomonas aeruginosa]|uniref:Uncharacterized protein n=1 Tax=Pseudomonas plecoglossicida TaxID=70775 RepID=A0ABX4U0B3_PSEDL|nr:hypothetical protein CXG44_08745 [Pseudomonas plecoglossicida]PLU93186.1 hypothetical protein CXG45_11715 [Pseudomonas plecoglossicida]PLV04203.1 hypothetical protein CXG48_10500 [Pseudomonas plecoglossicida]PLV13611.1 hypothetical protein CXG47_15140 [Pseudomonas plecoglossicida]RCI53459.1 hypothetical protein DT381_15560 [Pseudomonas aeruginosa]
MDAARTMPGQGWPVIVSPRSADGMREPRRSRGRMQGHSVLVTFARKSDSPAGRNPGSQPTS